MMYTSIIFTHYRLPKDKGNKELWTNPTSQNNLEKLCISVLNILNQKTLELAKKLLKLKAGAISSHFSNENRRISLHQHTSSIWAVLRQVG